MPGIAGLIGRMPREQALARVAEMLLAMTHEPFYAKGFYADEDMGLYAGWVVHPDSFSDCMPIENDDGSVAVLLHGEVYTPDHLLKRLSQNGRGSYLDATHLGHLYSLLEEGFFEELNGMFCGLIVNKNRRKLQLFNDRLGFEKLYYSHTSTAEDCFHFSSEAKSLLRVIPSTREFDREGLAQFLTYGCTFGERTLYKGVSLLPPASVWDFAPAGRISKRTYFRPEDWPTDPAIGMESLENNFSQTFPRVLPAYFAGRVPPGVSLTGGWDTRMIMASHAAPAATLPCYTFAGLSGETVDVKQARKVAEHLHQKHSVLRLQQDFLTNFEEHAQKTVYVSDGFGGVSLSHEIYLNRLARGVAAVRVTGNFGSEVLRGATTFKELPLRPDLFHRELGAEIASCREQMRTQMDAKGARFAIFTEIPWKHSTTVRLANSQLSVRLPFLDNEILRLATSCPMEVLRKSELPISLIKSENRALLSIWTDRGDSGAASAVRKAMMRLLYAGTFKLDYLANEGMPVFLSMVIDRGRLYRLLPLQHKYLHYRHWFGGPLRECVEGIIGNANSFVRGLVGRSAVDRVLRNNALSITNELPQIDALMTLELINKTLLSSPLKRGNVLVEKGIQ